MLFKSSIPGDWKGDSGNGFLSVSISSMAAFVAMIFIINTVIDIVVPLKRPAAVLVTYIVQHQ